MRNTHKIFGSMWPAAVGLEPGAFFAVTRLATWMLAVVVLAAGIAPEVNRRYGEGLALYTLLHLSGLIFYAAVLHPAVANSKQPWIKPPRDLVVLGIVDMTVSAAVVYYSGGWGSPFWHFAVTALLLPCFLVGMSRALLIGSVFLGLYVGACVLGGDGLQGAWTGSDRHMFAGFILTVYLVSLTVSFLGSMFRARDAERRRSQKALANLGTVLEVTRNVMAAPPEAEPLVRQVAQTLRQRLQATNAAIYLRDPDENILRLSASTTGLEEIDHATVIGMGDGPVGIAADSGATQVGSTSLHEWSAAIPLHSGRTCIGVLVVSSAYGADRGEESLELAETIANQIAVGLQNVVLRRRQTEMAASSERSRIARDIHDGLAQVLYALNLNLEACASIAATQEGPLKERLDALVPLAKQALLESRQYIFNLRPLLSGEATVDTALRGQANEFSAISGIPVAFDVNERPMAVSTYAAAALYRVMQEALANVLKHSAASSVSVSLQFIDGQVELTVRDNGNGFDIETTEAGYGLNNMRERALEAGGTLQASSAPLQGTCILLRVPVDASSSKEPQS